MQVPPKEKLQRFDTFRFVVTLWLCYTVANLTYGSHTYIKLYGSIMLS